jgi:hemimethylated DNA binding protein
MAIAEVLQNDLKLVEEEELLRIRSSNVSEFFTRFDSASKSFVPNEILEYEYPNDIMMSTSAPPQLSEATEAAAEDIIMGVKEAAAHMRSIMMGYTSAPESRDLKILGFFLEKLDAILDGDILEMKDKLFNKEMPSNRLAALHLQQLLNFTVNVGDLLWERRRATENTKENKFGLGDIVSHKVYGFRGVVVAWDPEPMMDVSMWDGLQHIDNPQDYPFYHIIPDHNDCIEAFGAERSSRYVCEENLVVCPPDQRSIDVDLEAEWRYDLEKKKYLPPLDLKVSFASRVFTIYLLKLTRFAVQIWHRS